MSLIEASRPNPRTTTAEHERVHDHVNVDVDVQVIVDMVVIGFCPRRVAKLAPPKLRL
jgi:hypothetical protein